jgi:hypothetical chaperone protein
MSERPTIFAIDFGTSNSLLSAAGPDRVFPEAPLDPTASDPTVLRSALYFLAGQPPAFGAQAPREFVTNGMRGRLIRSIKRHLPSPSFTATRIGERSRTLPELIGLFLATMRERACAHFGVDIERAVLGRPARFSANDREDALAEERLREAARLAGFREVTLCPEPVAAAYDFAEELAEPRTVLVADLGGGTSDFSLVRLGGGPFRAKDVLGVGGVAIAGDAIDGSLVRARVAPELGSKARYRAPFGENELTMPRDLVDLLCSSADLTLVDRRRVLERVANMRAGLLDPSEAELLERYAAVVEDGVGFQLFEAVEHCKRALSDVDQARIELDYPGVELALDVKKDELAHAAEPLIERILRALDETLRSAGVSANAVEIVSLTGGTSRMPLIEAALRQRLPEARFHRLKSFHSVVRGLAHKAHELAAGRPLVTGAA